MKRMIQLVDEISLKPFAALDAKQSEQIRAIRNEPDVRNNMYTNHEISGDEHDAWMKRAAADERTQMFAVEVDSAIVGAVGLTAMAPAHRRSEWAFYLSHSTQGKGIGSALEFKFLNLAFGDFGLHKLNCEVLAFNEAVIALHKKFGFREEGVRRAHISRDGQWIDTILLGMTAGEWREQEALLRQRLFKA